MDPTIRGLLERYEQLVLGKKEAQDALTTTIQLLREMKAGSVALSQVVITEQGWHLAQESPNGKAEIGEPVKERNG